ncbi:polysaccharide lyase family 8 super-sandwich domain-containing protein [Siphonobacter sp. SORGH_AS_0500]|uniref:polysaccharide lyase family 8 super-sandwich domain-containing protein n=1 Tax=Siphonobacter sp. SORGH_AS_0500 TaxID=1864824 RepID=UPI00285FC632|nr:polysaccharide lyase family 8 super-sandwich domain-containing protein [Siphonobacter sp. SORGH_AS_0500]MDR6197134.1 chondroitin AC lyase [Siphonobacter sp. SORGH_AS_0500]
MKYLYVLSFLLLGFSGWGQATGDFKIIMDRIFAGLQAGTNVTTLDASTASLLSSINADGSWSDIDYSNASTPSGWAPGTHFTRMNTLAKAYSNTSSSYYGNTQVRQAVIHTMNYWLSLDPAPVSSNWFYYAITLPKDIGNALIYMRYGPQPGLDASLESQMITWMTKGVNITTSPGNTGSNLTDIAQHYIMRACLTQNATPLSQAVTETGKTLVITSGEGIQADYSYTAHGQQLYIYGYGREFVSGVCNIGTYVTGTSYNFTAQQIAVFSSYVRKGFMQVARGRYNDFNVYGRGITRPNTGMADANLIERVKGIDLSTYASEYDAALSRMRGQAAPSYLINAQHQHYWRTDYTLHQRPGYLFGLRSVSSRTAKSESGNNENLKGYYLTEGVNFIGVEGDEYYNIYPVWDWNKLPGITVPEITTYPVRTSWGVNPGMTSFVGGVSDGTYGVSCYRMNDYSTTARKGWFFFDDEVVCLGAGISSSATQAINTTLNQCLLTGPVTVSDGNNAAVVPSGDYTYAGGTVKWIHHDQVGYYFPSASPLRVRQAAQTGSWSSINAGYASDVISKDVFKLWIPHGTSPANTSYAYVVLPGKNATEMAAYSGSHLSIIANTPAVQIVDNRTLDLWQVIFYEAGSFSAQGITLKVDKPCTLLLKNVTTSEVAIVAADPNQTATTLKVGLSSAALPVMKEVKFTLPQANGTAGSSVEGLINSSSPNYTEPVADSPVTLTAIADTYVRDGAAYQQSNYGTASTLAIKNDAEGYKREVYLKFDLSGFNAPLDSAILRLRVNNANATVTNTTWEFYDVADNSWTETGLTWSNRPLPGGKIGEVKGAVAGTYVTLKITNAVRARLAKDQILTLRVSSSAYGSTTDAQFTARENANASQRPQLTLYPSVVAYDQELARVTSVADAYVQGGASAATNYGSQTVLTLKNDASDNTKREVFLKFDLASLPSTAGQVLLQLYVPYAGASITQTTWECYEVADQTWTESGITWNTKPSPSLKLGEILGTSAGNFVTLDVTEWVRNKQRLSGGANPLLGSIKIISTYSGSTTDAQFSSREQSNTTFRPQLIAKAAAQSLPVVLTHFEGKRLSEESIELNWATAQEKNNRYFQLERSRDAQNFERIYQLVGQGTVQKRTYYQYVDAAKGGTFYYRLRQTDEDGKQTVSRIIAVTSPAPVLTIGPNPTSGWVRLNLNQEPTEPLTVDLYSSTGQHLGRQSEQKAIFDFDLSGLMKGVYLLKISYQNQMQTLRILRH